MKPITMASVLAATLTWSPAALAGPNLSARLVESSKDCVGIATDVLRKAKFKNVKKTENGNVIAQNPSTTVMVVCQLPPHVSVSVAGTDSKAVNKLADDLGLAIRD